MKKPIHAKIRKLRLNYHANHVKEWANGGLVMVQAKQLHVHIAMEKVIKEWINEDNTI